MDRAASILVLTGGVLLWGAAAMLRDSAPEDVTAEPISRADRPTSFSPELRSETRVATSPLIRSRTVDPAPVVPVPRPARLTGIILGDFTPGYGAAWIVEAYRLTVYGDSVLERRRVYADPDGRFDLAELRAGDWQVALVAPRFAWGPRVRVEAGEQRQLRLHPEGTHALHVEWPAGRDSGPATIELLASRSPALADSRLRLAIPVARFARRAADVVFRDLPAGIYEVRVGSWTSDAIEVPRDRRVEVPPPGERDRPRRTKARRLPSNR